MLTESVADDADGECSSICWHIYQQIMLTEIAAEDADGNCSLDGATRCKLLHMTWVAQNNEDQTYCIKN